MGWTDIFKKKKNRHDFTEIDRVAAGESTRAKAELKAIQHEIEMAKLEQKKAELIEGHRSDFQEQIENFEDMAEYLGYEKAEEVEAEGMPDWIQALEMWQKMQNPGGIPANSVPPSPVPPTPPPKISTATPLPEEVDAVIKVFPKEQKYLIQEGLLSEQQFVTIAAGVWKRIKEEPTT